jgi:hypothetical protein
MEVENIVQSSTQSRKTTFNSLRKAHLSENSLAWKSNLQKNKMMERGFFYSLKASVCLLYLEGGQAPERLCNSNICTLLSSFFRSIRTTYKWSSSNSPFGLQWKVSTYFKCLNKFLKTGQILLNLPLIIINHCSHLSSYDIFFVHLIILSLLHVFCSV